MKSLIAIAITYMVIFQTSSIELNLAIQNGELTQVTILLGQNKCLLNAKNYHGMTRLPNNTDIGNYYLIRNLFDQGNDIGPKDDNYGTTGIYYAAKNGNTEIANLLIEKNKTVREAKDLGLKKTLQVACESVNKCYSRDDYGWTPLHHAAANGKREMIQVLLEEEINLNARSIRGETAYNVAEFLGRNEIMSYLQKNGADTSEVQFPIITGNYMGQDPPGEIPEMFMPGIVSGPYRAHGTVVFSPDGKEAYWSDMFPNAQMALEMKMVNNQWSFPAKSIMWKDPSISPDGNRLIYISRDPVDEHDPADKENYWYMDRTTPGWTKPKPLDKSINNINIHWQCSMDNKGNLFFSEFENNMYISELKNGKYQEPVSLKLYFNNESLNGHSPFIDPSGDYLIFADHGRLYVSFKTATGLWTDRADLGNKINTGTACGAPRVTHDGKYLFFQSTSGEDRPWGIYWVSSEVIYRLQKELSRLY